MVEKCKCGKQYGEYVYHDFLITNELICEECYEEGNMSELSEKLLKDYLEDSLKLIEKLSNFIYDVVPDNDYWRGKLSVDVDNFETKTKELLKEKLHNNVNSIAP